MNRFQFGLCLSLSASIVFCFDTTKLDAQDSAGPKLIAPLNGAVLDNGRTDRLDVVRWKFEWTPVPNAEKYRLRVQRRMGKFPVVNRVIADTRFTKESTNYIIARNQKGWIWKVQARVNGKWGNWSEERTFDVEPLDTDLATIDIPKTDEATEHKPKTRINEDTSGTSTFEMLSRLQKQNEIDFDENLLLHKSVATYPRYKPGAASHEHLRFSANGKYIAIGGMSPWKPVGNGRMRSSGGGRIELWNVQSGKQTILSDDIKTFIHPTTFPVAFSQDSKLLAAADTNGQVKIWELSAEKISDPKAIKFKDKGQNSGIATALSFTPDSKRVLVGAYPTHQMEIESGKEIALCEDYSSSLLDPDVIELSPDGRTVAFGGLSTGVNFFDLNSGEISDELKHHRLFKEIYFYQFLPSGKLSIVAGGQAFGGSLVGINDNSVGKITSAISFTGEFPAVAVSLDGSTLAVTDAEIKKSKAYLTWQKQYQNDFKDEALPTLVSLWRINGRKLDFLGQVNTGNKEMVTAIGLSPDGTTLVTSGANLRFWDISPVAGQELPPSQKKQSGAPASDNQLSDSGSRISDPVSEIVFDKTPSHGGRRQVMFSPDEQVLASWVESGSSAFSLGSNEKIQLWNTSTGRVIANAVDRAFASGEYAFDSASQRFAYFDGQRCYVQNSTTGDLEATLNHSNLLRAQFLDGGRYLATIGSVGMRRVFGDEEVRLKIWDTSDWREHELSLGTFKIDPGFGFYHLAENGRIIVAVDEGTTLECWDVVRNRKLFTIDSIQDQLNEAFKDLGTVSRPLFRVENELIRAIGVTVINWKVKQIASVSYDLEDGTLLSVQSPLAVPDKTRAIGTWIDRSAIPPQMRIGQSPIIQFNRLLERERVWDFWNSEGQIERSVEWKTGPPYLPTGQSSESYPVMISSKNDTLAIYESATAPGTIVVYDTRQDPPKIVSSLITRLPVEKFVVAPDKKTLAVLSRAWRGPERNFECEVMITDFPAFERRLILEGHNSKINSIAFSPDGKLLAGAEGAEPHRAKFDASGGVKIWDVATGDLKNSLSFDSQIYGVAFDPNQKRLAAGGREAIYIWNLTHARLQSKLELDYRTTPRIDRYNGTVMRDHTWYLSMVRGLAFRNDGTLVSISGSPETNGSKLVLWNLADQKAMYGIGLDSFPIKWRLSSDQNSMGITSAWHVDRIELNKRKQTSPTANPNLRRIDGSHSSYSRVFEFDSNQDRLVAVEQDPGYWDGRDRITFHDSETGKAQLSYATKLSKIHSLSLMENNHFVIAGGVTAKTTFLNLFDSNSGREIGTIADQASVSFKFVSNGDLLVSRSLKDGQHAANLWQLSTGNKLAQFEHPNLQSTSLSPSGRYLTTISSDTIKIWSLAGFRKTIESPATIESGHHRREAPIPSRGQTRANE